MKKIVWIGLFAVSASVLSFAFVTGSSAGSSEKTLTFINRPLNETGFDIDGDQNLTPADGWVANSELLKGGDVVGRLVTSCQYVQVRADGMGGVLQCVGTAKLPGGQIAVQSRQVLVEGKTTSADAAITGGTGDYSTARGYVRSEAIPGSMNARITVHLVS